MSQDAPPRQHWDRQLQFVLSTVGFSIDLANVWRFPYLCYKYGGGAFLIPYVLMNVLQALPMLYMEMCLGQTQQQGVVQVWDIVPAARGIGVGQCLMNVGMFYYNVMIGWCIYFLVNSFGTDPQLPWMRCNHEFNTEWCRTVDEFKNLTLENKTGFSVLSSTEYFERGVLGIQHSSSVQSLGSPRFVLAACNLVGFVLLFLALRRGVKSFGNFAYITAPLPVLLLLVLLVNGALLPGAGKGIEYYITPKPHLLADVFAWIEAAIQVFYSAGAGFGVHLTLSSYSRKSNNCYRDALIAIVANALFSFFAGFVVFAYLGYMAHVTGRDVENVATDGPGLTFQVYPLAVGTLPAPQLWSALFFLMLVNLGLNSSMGGIESMLTALGELLQRIKSLRGKYFRVVLTAVFLLCYYALSLLLNTPGGMYLWSLQNNFVPGLSLIFMAFSTAIAVSWLYGLDEFCNDIKKNIGLSPGIFWRICWKFVSPAFILAIIIVTIITSVDTTSFMYFYQYTMYHPELFANRTANGLYFYYYNDSTKAIAWTVTLVQIAAVFLFIIVAMVQYRSPLKAITPIKQHALVDAGVRRRAELGHWLSLGPPTAWPMNLCCPKQLQQHKQRQQEEQQQQQQREMSELGEREQQYRVNGGFAQDEADTGGGGAAAAQQSKSEVLFERYYS